MCYVKKLPVFVCSLVLALAFLGSSTEAQIRERDSVRQWWRSQNLATEVGKNHELVKKAFRDVILSANDATVRIYQGDRLICLGTIVDPVGYIVTKSSEVSGNVSVRVADGKRYEATIVGADDNLDLKMLKIDAGNLPFARLASSDPSVGAWVASPGGLRADPLAVGVVSVAARPIEQQQGALGIIIDNSDEGPLVREVFGGSGAKRAGIREDDVITRVDNQAVDTREELIARIKNMRPGDRVTLQVLRDGETRRITATLSRRYDLFMNEEGGVQEEITGPLSVRRSGFPAAVQHDCLLNPNQCGGPLVDLSGKIIGINIARSDRVCTYALTADVVIPWVETIKSGTPRTARVP
jgi:serine protease Do